MNVQAPGDEGSHNISVAIIEPVGGHGGMHYYDFGLCRGLLSAGCRVSLYTCDKTPAPDIPGLTFFPFYREIYGKGKRWLRGLRFVRGTFASIRHAVNSGVTICHFHAFNHFATDFAVIVIARLFGRRVVVTVHDVDSLARSEVRGSRLTKWLYGLADRVIVHNKVSALELERIGLHPDKIAIIAHGHYLKSVRELPVMQKARHALRIELSAKVILFFGQIKHSKGLDLLIETIPQLAHAIPEIVVVIAGRPWKADFAHYDALIDHLNVRDYCHLRTSFIPDQEVAGFYAAADLVVLPYRRIYQSGVLLMAMTFGRPAVVSDLPGMSEIVTDSVNGYVFKNGSKDELAKVLIRALRDDSGRRQVVTRASDYIRQHHDWNHIGARTLDVYRKVLWERGTPPI